MHYLPDLDQFVTIAQANPGATIIPVWRVLTSDTLTPVTAFLLLDDGSDAFLFESVVGGERVGRYSFVGAGPLARYEIYEGRTQFEIADRAEKLLEGVVAKQLGEAVRQGAEPFEHLKGMLKLLQSPHLQGLPRFSGGAVGYMAYDAIRYVERLPHAPPDDRHLPDASFGIYDDMVVFDHIQKTTLAISHAHLPPASEGGRQEETLREAYRLACERVDRLVERLSRRPPSLPPVDIARHTEPSRPFRSNFERAQFESAVERCKEYIRAGDIFQVVISQRLETETYASPFDIYRALRIVNPSPFMFFLRTANFCLVGASPEIMVRVEDGTVVTRPLAGTRPRGRTPQEDDELARELLADEKERAEHVMLVDLGRNDIGRVAQYGTVRLDDVMTVERYSHVMHITTHVSGRLRPQFHALDALRACLPAGTVSGAPKVRAMEIIDELEPHRRGPYAGAVGYVDYTGNMDTCIALRTMVVLDNRVYVQAGAGIVYDSVPSREYEETLNKARGLLKAIELAERNLARPARSA